KRAYCLKTQPATGETYPKSDLFNKATINTKAFFLSCNVLPDWGTEVMPVNPVPLPRSKYLLNSFYLLTRW
ncbi:hypothetical protein, partial [Salmonella enterica]|uniref:hypothetical protein n=1 Tax=Salmonella enterica TaxID=28901 RepID=UPI0034A470EF